VAGEGACCWLMLVKMFQRFNQCFFYIFNLGAW
jgi:hypothetical protein